MPRKCCTFYNGESCKSGYATSIFTSLVFGFPSDSGGKEKWRQALPNIDQKVTKYIGIFELHWSPNYEFKTVQNGTKRPIHTPFVFGDTSSTYTRQTILNKVRDTKRHSVLPCERSKNLK